MKFRTKHMKRCYQLWIAKLDGRIITVNQGSLAFYDIVSDHEETDCHICVCFWICELVTSFKCRNNSRDTAVQVLTCYHYHSSLRNLTYLSLNLGSKNHFIWTHNICNEFTCFLQSHGRDSTASFLGIWKKKAFKVLSEKNIYYVT